MSKTRVLIIEDEKLIRWSLRQRFMEEGYIADEAETGGEGLRKLRNVSYDLITLDYKLPDMTGLEVLRNVRKIDADIVVVMLTAYSNVEDAVTAMRLGAFDYVSKPFKMDELMQTIEHGLETTLLKRQVRDFRAQMKSRFGIEGIIGASPVMLELFAIIRDVAASGASTIFITGESGTGKDLVAKTIHYNSDRADHPFMNITCTAMAETLLESELFGYERGAFTDAKSLKKGLLEVSHGGTVFLDEVGDMPLVLQSKLLRFLEERMFRRVGGVHDIEVDVRVIAATNRNIEKAVEQGKFREDLYYRLNIIPIHLSPLRQRGADVLLLAKHFVACFSSEFRKPITEIRRDAEDKLMSHAWPGNVRELRNAVERAVLLCKHDYIDAGDLVLGRATDQPGEAIAGLQLPPKGVNLARVEEQLVRQALKRTNGNQTHAASLLSLSRDQLRYRLQKYGLL
ncbi:MAG: sigma-54-dependent Fis family transcriptional regulator [Phycisphaerae bacterium]|nr:sigma-54-dependent Fis family transcriptional regulator [Phycisphaerae bacterium]